MGNIIDKIKEIIYEQVIGDAFELEEPLLLKKHIKNRNLLWGTCFLFIFAPIDSIRTFEGKLS